MSKVYDVSISCSFDAASPEEAIRLFVRDYLASVDLQTQVYEVIEREDGDPYGVGIIQEVDTEEWEEDQWQ